MEVFYFCIMKPPIVILFCLFCYACNPNVSQPSIATTPNLSFKDTLPEKEIAGNFSNQTNVVFDSTVISLFLQDYPNFQSLKSELHKFYRNRNYAYAWQISTGLIEQSYILYNTILQNEDNALPQDIPYAEEYKKMMEQNINENLLFRELMITCQYLHYAKYLLSGIPESDIKALGWFIPRKKINYTALLDTILNNKLIPFDKIYYPQYAKLKSKLQFFKNLEKKSNWETVVSVKKSYKIGDSSIILNQIKEKLFLLGDLTTNNHSNLFDTELLYGIKRFQRRFGLTQDGVLGKVVIAKLNQPISTSIKQILINMERCRWLPNETDKDYIMVNIPEFKLYAYIKDSIAFSCNVVVGKLTNKTVIFRGIMQYIVLSPYWNIPSEILAKEILPAISKNPNYLRNHDMEWSNGKLRQRPGLQNALGKIKFVFPNSYNIYLHDTPSKLLFNADKRAFSHGCIRVSEPLTLALYLLRNDTTWNENKLLTEMNSMEEKYLTLKNRVPVYIIYLTSFVDENGEINFRDDIYNRDEQLKDMIFVKNQEKLIK